MTTTPASSSSLSLSSSPAAGPPPACCCTHASGSNWRASIVCGHSIRLDLLIRMRSPSTSICTISGAAGASEATRNGVTHSFSAAKRRARAWWAAVAWRNASLSVCVADCAFLKSCSVDLRSQPAAAAYRIRRRFSPFGAGALFCAAGVSETFGAGPSPARRFQPFRAGSSPLASTA